MATGIGPITPISQFEILRTDPWTNAINAYMGVKEGQGRGLENQKIKEEMPYVGPRQDAALKQAILMNQGLDYKNQQSSAEAPYYGQNAESDAYKKQMEAAMYEDMKRADIERQQMLNRESDQKLNDPWAGAGGTQGLLSAYNSAVKRGDPNAPLLLNALKRSTSGMSGNASGFKSWPMDVKRALIAQGTGMGIDQSIVATRLAQGYTIPELAAEFGISEDQIPSYDSVYNATQPNITAAKNRDVAAAELDYLQPLVSEARGEYISKMPINGYSPAQALDLALGMNEDKQIRFMAGQMIEPELTLLRLRQVGSEISHAQYQSLAEKSVGMRKTFETGMTPDIYIKANSLANEWLKGAKDVANKEMYSPAQAKKQNNKDLTSAVKNNLSGNGAGNIQSLSDEELQAAYEASLNGGAM